MKFEPLIAWTLLLGACADGHPVDTSRILSVDEVMQNIHSLDGKQVRVAGYMPKCGSHDCGLFSNVEMEREFWRIADEERGKGSLPTYLSIGFDEAFDRKASPLAGRYVVVTGKVSAECRGPSGESQCLDRAPDIKPIDIRLMSEPKTTSNVQQ